MELNLSNPVVIIVGGIVFLVLIYFWNKFNSKTQSQRRRRNFRSNYQQKRGSEKK